MNLEVSREERFVAGWYRHGKVLVTCFLSARVCSLDLNLSPLDFACSAIQNTSYVLSRFVRPEKNNEKNNKNIRHAVQTKDC